MPKRTLHKAIIIFIGIVWILNGLLAKIMNLVPRHQEIVAEIVSQEHARTITLLIGLAELVMAAWVLSKWKIRFNAITQILVIGTMNLLEFLRTPNLLLWGKMNSIFALCFMGLIFYNAFVLFPKVKSSS